MTLTETQMEILIVSVIVFLLMVVPHILRLVKKIYRGDLRPWEMRR